jgi:hypothetical protein
MSLKEFFLNGAMEYGIPNVKVESVKNTGSKRAKHRGTFKITDTLTSREYFIRSGDSGYGWCTVKCNKSRGVVQYGVLSLGGFISPLDLTDSIYVVERHIAKQRKKLNFSETFLGKD